MTSIMFLLLALLVVILFLTFTLPRWILRQRRRTAIRVEGLRIREERLLTQADVDEAFGPPQNR